ncbi:acid protease [Pleurotus eryngii]|uniref:Acid protease n=1 Tax=Pleurotus eryngii TaxID=5323 RepID=A0A9P6DJ32_PLEER|nr:acid protease [Pleurotus eryngii]
MYALLSVLALLFFSSGVSWGASVHRRSDGGIHVPVMPTVRSKRQIIAKHDGLSAAVGLGDYKDVSYSVRLLIGGEEVPVVLDTGSADLWVASNACTACSAKGTQVPLYSQSSLQRSGLDVRLQYGDSRTGTHAYGPIGHDTVGLPGLTLPAQYLAAINDTNTSVLDAGCAGIFGLGFPINSFIWHDVYVQSLDPMIPQRRSSQFRSLPSSRDQSTSISRLSSRQLAGSTATNAILSSLPLTGPFIPRLVMDGVLKSPMFTVALQRDAVEVGGNAGMFSVGELPPDLKPESMTWSPVRGYTVAQKGLPPPVDSPFETYPMTWEVFMDDVYFDGVKLPRSALPSPNVQLSALIDTGNSLIRGPADVVANIFSKLGSNQFDCSVPHTLAFQINGTFFPVDPRDFITSVSRDSADKCFANLVETDTPVEGENYLYSWSLGAPFLKGVMATFYYGNITYPSQDSPRIGFKSTVPPDAGDRLKSTVAEALRIGSGFSAIVEPAPSGSFGSARINPSPQSYPSPSATGSLARSPSPTPVSTTTSGDGSASNSNSATSLSTGVWTKLVTLECQTLFIFSGYIGLLIAQFMTW